MNKNYVHIPYEEAKGMTIKDTCKAMKELLCSIDKDLEKAEAGNKAAAQRVRTCSIKFEKAAKLYRKLSVKEGGSKSTGKRKSTKAKKAAKPKAVVKKVAKAISKTKSKAKRKVSAVKKSVTKRKAPAKRKARPKSLAKKRTTAKVRRKKK